MIVKRHIAAIRIGTNWRLYKERILQLHHKRVLLVQATWRGLVGRRRAQKQYAHLCVVVIQCGMRCFKAWMDAEERRAAILLGTCEIAYSTVYY